MKKTVGEFARGEPVSGEWVIELAVDTTLPVFKLSLLDRFRIRLASFILGKRLWRQWRDWHKKFRSG